MYEVVQINDGRLIGGHCAVQGPDGTMIGREFKLDYYQASVLSHHLKVAFQKGIENGRMAHTSVD